MFVVRHMTRNPVTVSPETLVPEARAILDRYDFRHLPVTGKDGTLLGMATDRDIRSAFPSSVTTGEERERILERVRRTKISAIMSMDVVCLSETSTLDDALLLLEGRKVGAIPVLDERERITGIFSIRDLISAYRSLFGLGEKGSSLVAVEDDGRPDIMLRIVHVLTENRIPFTRIIHSSGEPGGERGLIYLRLTTFNIKAVHETLGKAGLCYVTPHSQSPATKP